MGHCRQEELQGRADLLVARSGFQVLDENPSRNVKAKGNERTHLNILGKHVQLNGSAKRAKLTPDKS
jgi:hypothetical protein